MGDLSLEDAAELAELTDRIVRNLAIINNRNGDDLDELDEQTTRIVRNLQTIAKER